MRSTDPTTDVIGLYLDPPQHAVVFCINEKTAIQALDRIDPLQPLSPGWAERHGQSFCPYLVGTYDEVGDELGRYMRLGYTTYILDVPASEDDLHHTKTAFERAQASAGAFVRCSADL